MFSGIAYDQVAGLILSASTNSSLHASLDLPIPNFAGSLGSSSSIFVNGQSAYQTDLRFASLPGTYGLNDSIKIEMEFSTNVYVLGEPAIKIAAGNNPRFAYYRFGHLTNILTFIYEPQPGDYTNQLDYAVDRRLLSSAADSMLLDNGSILTYSTVPSVEAYIHLNPFRGTLSGSTNLVATDGTFSYLDLAIGQMGPDYLLRYYSIVQNVYSYTITITTTQTLFVSFTNQYELKPKEALSGHLVSWSTDLYNDIRFYFSYNFLTFLS
jgi:hypothetical protein